MVDVTEGSRMRSNRSGESDDRRSLNPVACDQDHTSTQPPSICDAGVLNPILFIVNPKG